MRADRTGAPRAAESGPSPAAPESVATMRDAAGRPLARWLCTPGRLDHLAAGWLASEGLVRDRAELVRLEVTGPGEVTVELAPAALARLGAARARPEPGPAPSGLPEGIPSGPRRAGTELSALLDDPPRLAALFAEAFRRSTLRDEAGGGLHTGARVARGAVADVAEDVSRSAVVDKLVGAALLAGAPPDDTLLLLSGRISAPIAAKLARAGVAAAATISIPTTLAVEIATRAGISLVGRARRGSPWRYGPA
jgi:FdhD protein